MKKKVIYELEIKQGNMDQMEEFAKRDSRPVDHLVDVAVERYLKDRTNGVRMNER